MIPLWHEELKSLSEVESHEHGAVTFYFAPTRPRNKAHREEAILVKDLVRDARKRLERSGNHQATRALLDRILTLAEQLPGNGSRTKAVFACAEKDIWKEFDLPGGGVGKTQLHLNHRFHLKPFAAAVLDVPHCMIVLADQKRARILDLYLGEISEREQIVDDVPRRVRSDGFEGYNAGHVERHVENEVMRHFKKVAGRVKDLISSGDMDMVIFCTRAEVWPELEPHLHSYVTQRLIGKLELDPAMATATEIRSAAQRLIDEHREGEREALIREIMGEADRDGRGSLGLKHVITSLERGEVQALLVGYDFSAAATECSHCGHMDTRMVKQCAVCGQNTRHLDDISDALVGYALRNSVEIHYVRDEEFARRGNIGALLRFRADRSTPNMMAG